MSKNIVKKTNTKKKKKAKNLTTKIFAYLMLILAVVSAVSSIIAYTLSK